MHCATVKYIQELQHTYNHDVLT